MKENPSWISWCELFNWLMIYNTDDIRSKPLVNLSDGKRKNMPGDIYIYIYIYISQHIYIYITANTYKVYVIGKSMSGL